MASGQISAVVRFIQKLTGTRRTDLLADGSLLDRFVTHQDESAFATLMHRHGPLVVSVCRSILSNESDVEDAFQATFLVLVRKAGSISKRESLASWLYGVAYRIAVRAKSRAGRTTLGEAECMDEATLDPSAQAARQEIKGLLHQEVHRLPDKYRLPVLLCYLEGLTRDAAARQLGWKEGVMRGRLERARDLLRARLRRRGITLSAVGLTGLFVQEAAAATVPAKLIEATARVALSVAAGKTLACGILSTNVITLADGVLKAMLLTKLKIACVAILLVGSLSVGVGMVYYHAPAMGSEAVPAAKPQAPEKDDKPDPGIPSLFEDKTLDSGIDIAYHNGEEAGHLAILESLGGGAALLDFDGDGLLDIFICGGGKFGGQDNKEIQGLPCKLYKNLGNGKFKDITAEAGLDIPWFYTHGVAVADYDCDGWPDLLVTGWGRLALFHNTPVDPNDPKKGRKFVDVTEKAGLPKGLWTTSAAWADFDGDGYPDLYVCQYVNWSFANHPTCAYDGKTLDVCPPKQFKALPHKLFRNNGDGTFTDVSKSAGLRVPREEKDYQDLKDWLDDADIKRLKEADKDQDYGKGMGVVAVDINADGKPDLYVANDTTDNFLYVNVSEKGKIRFKELGMASGTARDDHGTPNGSMGIGIADFNGSGRPSIFVANYENEMHALYINICIKRNGRDRILFNYGTQAVGIAAIGQIYVGFGAAFIDVDNDGWEDIFISNGHAIRFPTGRAKRAQAPMLLRNVLNPRGGGAGRRFFTNWSKDAGSYFDAVHQGRGCAVGDFDNDGRLDLLLTPLNEPAALLLNTAGKENHWLGIELKGQNHHDVTGALLTLEVEDRILTRFAKNGGSYLSASDPRHVFGLGDAKKVGKLTVTWPSGETQEWRDLKIDQYWRLEEGKKEPQNGAGAK
jgi:RNA polymerase sigma factor (sigma-70 family)